MNASAPDLKLVKSDRNPELLRIISEGNYNLPHLEQQYGISVYYLKKDYGAKSGRRGRPKASQVALRKALKPVQLPVVRQAVKADGSPLPPVAAPRSLQDVFLWLVMWGLALTLGAVGIALNWQFAMATFSSTLLAVVGAAIDVVTIVLLAIASTMWDQNRKVQWFAALVLWLLCFGLSNLAAMSFAASNVGDSLQGREAIAQHRKVLEWARLWRDAQEETEAKFGEDDLDNSAWNEPLIGTAPATIYLLEAIERNGCGRASQLQSDIFWQMQPTAEMIRESEVTSLAGLRAKCLVSILDFMPGQADHAGNLSFDSVENSHFSLFSAAVAITGLGDFVGDIDRRLKADAGTSLRDGGPVTV